MLNTLPSRIVRPLATLFLLGCILFESSARAAGPGTNITSKSDWWSFKPASQPALPILQHSSALITNPIDLFIRARLEPQNLPPSPAVDPATFIRRVTYDLIGLPPTPEETESFVRAAVADRPAAIAALVDRLLASPRHGERWARHWLDVVHFGETHGYDKDKLRPNAWPYRDYVIGALNQDMPWSRFLEQQLAGDILYPDDPDGIVALGFIAAGPWDFVGHAELPESKTDGLLARYNDRDDMVMTTFSAFQSLTVHCARCHDHKFDPITQRDYYNLQSVFAGVDRANRPFDSDPAVHRRRRALLTEKQSLESRQQELKETLSKLSSPELRAVDAQLASLQSKTSRPAQTGKKSPGNGYHSGIESKPDATKWVQVDLGRPIKLDEIRLVPARPTDFPDTPGFGFPVRFKIELANDAAFTNAFLLADHTGGDYANPGDQPVAIALQGRAGVPPAASAPSSTSKEGQGGRLPYVRFIRVTATRLWERTRDYVFALSELQAFAGGSNVARNATVTALDSIESGRWARKNLVDGFSSRAELIEVPLSAEELSKRRALEADLKQLSAVRQRLFESLVPEANKIESTTIASRLGSISNTLASLPAPSLVYAGASDFKTEGSFKPAHGMRPVHLLQRGDVKRPMELVTPAGPACIPGPDPEFHLAPQHSEGDRRAALAKWLTDPRNLQTRRSIVNRVWQYHFGRGLVDSPNDFGHMGSLPSHPELLDWLASWFLHHGESLKQLHRLIVTSETYQQISGDDPAATRNPKLETRNSRDADNRLLWRMNRSRLDAECIHDAILSASGQLDLTMGGPGDRQFFFKDDHSPVYDYTRFDVDAKEGRRRSIYRHIVRSVPDPFMDCLDAADPSQLVARRNTTLTALQALATLNNAFVLRQCEHFAERLQKMSPEVDAQVEAAYRIAFNRKPSPTEQERLAAHVRRHGLANACRVLFNSTEFMFVD